MIYLQGRPIHLFTEKKPQTNKTNQKTNPLHKNYRLLGRRKYYFFQHYVWNWETPEELKKQIKVKCWNQGTIGAITEWEDIYLLGKSFYISMSRRMQKVIEEKLMDEKAIFWSEKMLQGHNTLNKRNFEKRQLFINSTYFKITFCNLSS